ncbi:MAG TPA: hypothetical protein PLN52_06795 [Opitutaceae bacterium]|nr:hypothetical protein [Opitutaceae bacterium]
MPYTTLTVRQDVAKRLRGSRQSGESYSDVISRLLDNQPAKTVGDWLNSLEPLEGRTLFSPEERTRLVQDQRSPRASLARRKARATA